MTANDLARIMGILPSRADMWLKVLEPAMIQDEIHTATRQAMFLAQVGHESGSFQFTREIASGAAYEGRRDLGNVQQGDGRRFRGRGLIQITGRSNYAQASQALYGDDRLILNPELLEQPPAAAISATWWWKNRGLNEIADDGTDLAFVRITRRINGGTNGLDDRRTRWARAKAVLGVS
jgi:putative chitinase